MTRVDHTEDLLPSRRRPPRRRHRPQPQAITGARRTGQAVTLATIARVPSVSRGSLYNQPDVRGAIGTVDETCPAASVPGPAAQRATTDPLHQRLDAARSEIGRLRTDDALLRDQLERSLGAERLHR